MRKYVFVFIASLVLTSGFSQKVSKEERKRRLELKKSGVKDEDICKFIKNEVDEFTGNRVLITEERRLSKIRASHGVAFSVRKIDETIILDIKINHNAIFSINKQGSIMMKSIAGEVEEIQFQESQVANGVYIQSLNYTAWVLNTSIVLTEKDVNRFLDKGFERIRWYTTDGYINEDIEEKDAYNLSKSLKCVAEYSN